jgi:hypothetical protein
VAALALALTLTLSGHAQAQGPALPSVQTQGNIRFISGGVGEDEAKAMHQALNRWPLSMSFFGPAGVYLADVRVRIVDSKGKEVLQTDTLGPYLLASLPSGRYTIYARYTTEEQRRVINVSGRGHYRLLFRFRTE